MSTRIISLYDSRNPSEVLSTLEVSVAPSTLIPFYDEDSAVLFLSAKVWKCSQIPGDKLILILGKIKY